MSFVYILKHHPIFIIIRSKVASTLPVAIQLLVFSSKLVPSLHLVQSLASTSNSGRSVGQLMQVFPLK